MTRLPPWRTDPLQVLKEANVIIEWRRMIVKFPVSALFVVAV
jgi:hypothetical protein